MSLEIQKLETVYRGYSTVMRATLAGPDGATSQREISHHGNAAAVLAYDPVRRMALLVRQPRAPVIWSGGPAELAEAIAGMVDGEDPAACARREALEEAGVQLDDLEPLGAPYAAPGVSSERVHLFLGVYSPERRVAEGGGAEGEDENITVEEVPLAELWAAVQERRIEDMKTLALTLALFARRPELFA